MHPAFPRFERLRLSTPPLPCLTAPAVWDAFGWCQSTTLTLRKPPGPLAPGEAIDGKNPDAMAFVFRKDDAAPFLPRELAALHIPRLCAAGAQGHECEREWILAPYAIDDATDELFAHQVPPDTVFELAADRLTALVWGLHDWAHFHNHGPFEERAETELQCDAAALVWLRVNRITLACDDAHWEAMRRALVVLSERRFESEGRAFDEARLSAERLDELARACARATQRERSP
ncbi:MAG: hypothetical protein IPG50_15090 [Myxococcales bacterium]|nr:hypothetical protein [Myxococcales bacterium]